MREFLAVMLGVLSCGIASEGTGGPVTVELSLAGGKASYLIGEPIVLALKFTANEPGLSLNMTTTAPASPVDALFLSPMTGVFPWLADHARRHPYSPDYAGLSPLEVNKPMVV